MKIKGKDVLGFDDDAVLDELATYYIDIRRRHALGKIKRPPHPTSFIAAFREIYGVVFSSDEEFLELREFIESGDYEMWKAEKIREETANATIVRGYE